jgi:oligopeptide transport system permease protein
VSGVDVRPPAVTDPPEAGTVRARSPGLVRSALSDRRAWIALPPLLLLVAMAIVPDWFDGAGPRPCDLRSSLSVPSLAHPFGLDLQGCDLWGRTVHGTRNSVLIGFGSVAIAGLVAMVLGTAAGMSRWADAVVRTLVDLFLGIPVVLIGLTVLTATEQPGPWHVIAVLSFFGWPLLTRVMRTEVLRVSGREYVDAARALGTGPWRVLRRHVAPNAVGSMLSIAVLAVATMITTEAVITYVGAGLQLPDTSWGILMFEAGRSLRRGFHLALPGLFLVVAVASLVLLAEVVRDARPPS